MGGERLAFPKSFYLVRNKEHNVTPAILFIVMESALLRQCGGSSSSSNNSGALTQMAGGRAFVSDGVWSVCDRLHRRLSFCYFHLQYTDFIIPPLACFVVSD
jgi:hypothetical protein